MRTRSAQIWRGVVYRRTREGHREVDRARGRRVIGWRARRGTGQSSSYIVREAPFVCLNVFFCYCVVEIHLASCVCVIYRCFFHLMVIRLPLLVYFV